MSLPRVAIVGRPNVGKSSLLNMLARAKVSIVDPTPGVTRDRVSIVVELPPPDEAPDEPHRMLELTDTGGYGVYTAEGARFDDAGEDLQRLTGDIERQIAAAVDGADLILFVLDAQSGITTLDETIAELLRKRLLTLGEAHRQAPPIQVVANKVDAVKWEPHAYEFAALGFGEPWLVSAAVNYNRRVFREMLYRALPMPREDEPAEAGPEMKIALVGKRNAGKSSFTNALAGTDRVIVSEIAGTTRDAVDVRFDLGGRSLVAIDTAGVRKRSKFADRVEVFANKRMGASVQRADVVLLLIDSTQKVSAIDKRLGAFVAESHKPCVIVVNKWDLADGRKNKQGREVGPGDYQKYIERTMPGLSFAPIIFTSAAEGFGVRETIDLAFELFEQSRTRLSTGKVNRVVRDIVDERGPSGKLGTRAKIYFASQVATRPPTIVLVVNKPDLFEGNYERFLLNRLRETTPFTEVPIRLIIRERRRADLGDLLSGRHRGQRTPAGAVHPSQLQEADRIGPLPVEGIDQETMARAMEDDELDDAEDLGSGRDALGHDDPGIKQN